MPVTSGQFPNIINLGLFLIFLTGLVKLDLFFLVYFLSFFYLSLKIKICFIILNELHFSQYRDFTVFVIMRLSIKFNFLKTWVALRIALLLVLVRRLRLFYVQRFDQERHSKILSKNFSRSGQDTKKLMSLDFSFRSFYYWANY